MFGFESPAFHRFRKLPAPKVVWANTVTILETMPSPEEDVPKRLVDCSHRMFIVPAPNTSRGQTQISPKFRHSQADLPFLNFLGPKDCVCVHLSHDVNSATSVKANLVSAFPALQRCSWRMPIPCPQEVSDGGRESLVEYVLIGVMPQPQY